MDKIRSLPGMHVPHYHTKPIIVKEALSFAYQVLVKLLINLCLSELLDID